VFALVSFQFIEFGLQSSYELLQVQQIILCVWKQDVILNTR